MKKDRVGLALMFIGCLSIVFFGPDKLEASFMHLSWYYGSYLIVILGIGFFFAGLASTIRSYEESMVKIYDDRIETLQKMTKTMEATNQKE